MTAELVITATAAVSPFGIGAEAFRTGLNRNESIAPAPITGCHGQPLNSLQVPAYDARALLAVRSISQFDRLTLHVCVAVDELLRNLGFADAAARAAQVTDDRISLVLGSSGPMQSIMAFDLQTIEDPRYVQPSLVPNVVFNVPASYAAIRHVIRGSCITLTDGPTSSLKALAMAQTQIESGRIALALCGGAEEATPAYALYAQALRAKQRSANAALCEGAALFALETADHARAHGRHARAGLLGCAQAFAPQDAHQALAHAVERLRAKHPSAMREVSRVYAGGGIDTARLGLPGVKLHDLGRQLGDMGSMPASLGVLDLIGNPAIAAGELVLVLQAEADGCGAAALLRKH